MRPGYVTLSNGREVRLYADTADALTAVCGRLHDHDGLLIERYGAGWCVTYVDNTWGDLHRHDHMIGDSLHTTLGALAEGIEP